MSKERVGLAILALFALVGLCGPLVVAPPHLDLAKDLAAGHGEGGVGVFSSLVWGARASLVVATASTLIALVIAIAVGVTAGARGGFFCSCVQRVVDVVLAFPSLLLALALCALLPPSPASVVLALSATAWAGPLRVLCALSGEVAARDHVRSARALGASLPRIVVVHVLPLLRVPLAIQATQAFAGAVVAEASLSFLGLGAPPLQPPFYTSWGQQLDDGIAYLWAAPHLWAPPGLCIFLVAVAAQLVADGLAARE